MPSVQAETSQGEWLACWDMTIADIKSCDETRPKCINCVTAHLTCPYENDVLSVESRSDAASNTRVTGTPSSATVSAGVDASRSPGQGFNSSPYVPINTDDVSVSPLNMLHLELLYHWSGGLYKSFLLSQADTKLYADVCMKHGLQFPFLMRQILATSALSMSLWKPEQREYYHQHAVQLQSEALVGFNATVPDLGESNIVAAFLVSSLIGLHSFCETFSFRDGDFNNTLDAFVGCVHLLRGIRSIIGGWWSFLLSSELNPVLSLAHGVREKSMKQPSQLNSLRELIHNADIGTTSQQAYESTIDELEQVYSAQTDVGDPQNGASANMIFGWLVVVPREYVDLVAQRRPEALIILAYYAVILHRRKQFWAINDAGQFLMSGIRAHLGKHWEQCLEWPNSHIEADAH